VRQPETNSEGQERFEYRGYQIEVIEQFSLWIIHARPTHKDLPRLLHPDVYRFNRTEAIVEIKRRIDGLLLEGVWWMA
jgi:hypothetical protein